VDISAKLGSVIIAVTHRPHNIAKLPELLRKP
jgi:hypothetical protein